MSIFFELILNYYGPLFLHLDGPVQLTLYWSWQTTEKQSARRPLRQTMTYYYISSLSSKCTICYNIVLQTANMDYRTVHSLASWELRLVQHLGTWWKNALQYIHIVRTQFNCNINYSDWYFCVKHWENSIGQPQDLKSASWLVHVLGVSI